MDEVIEFEKSFRTSLVVAARAITSHANNANADQDDGDDGPTVRTKVVDEAEDIVQDDVESHDLAREDLDDGVMGRAISIKQ